MDDISHLITNNKMSDKLEDISLGENEDLMKDTKNTDKNKLKVDYNEAPT